MRQFYRHVAGRTRVHRQPHHSSTRRLRKPLRTEYQGDPDEIVNLVDNAGVPVADLGPVAAEMPDRVAALRSTAVSRGCPVSTPAWCRRTAAECLHATRPEAAPACVGGVHPGRHPGHGAQDRLMESSRSLRYSG